MLEKLIQLFLHKPAIDREAFEAYFDRLPDQIEIKWFRDGGFIIGDIKTEKHHFKTQGISVDDFVGMVNDSLYTVYDIPKNYIAALSKSKYYNPDPSSLEQLNNLGIKQSQTRFQKEKVKFV